MNATGTVQIVTGRGSPSSARLPGQELIFADDLDVASDGTVYFSTMHDVPVIKDKTGEYEALQPCLLNILQVRAAEIMCPCCDNCCQYISQRTDTSRHHAIAASFILAWLLLCGNWSLVHEMAKWLL